ncbi:MAG: hypothetical protein AAB449_00740 [Patescibacteria group bacterium]
MAKEKDTHRLVQDFMGFTKRQFELQEKLIINLGADIRDLKEGQLMLEKQLDETQIVLRGVQRAIDRDSVKIINHERRITRLERTR